MTLAGLLERAILRHPHGDAVVDGPTRLSYADLGGRTAALARGLSRLGVGPGDRVLLVLRNRAEHVLAYWALQRLGGVPVPVNVRLTSGDLAYLVEDSGACLAVCESATAPAVLDAARGRDVRLIFVGSDAPPTCLPFEALMGDGPGSGVPGPSEGDLSLMLYTSGTTGRPKGVPRTQRNHYAGALAHALQCGYEWGERTLGVMPLYHTMGIHALTSMVAVNGCFVCQPDWSPASALRL
ncbi:MAG: class I adenylate-forming enzyme family protein, partial [Candidatus Rokuibacteriota bacterium]